VELFTAVAKFHDTHTCASPVKHLTLRMSQNFFWEAARAGGEVEDFLAVGTLLLI